jgi:superfamily II DNA or RNA helicase
MFNPYPDLLDPKFYSKIYNKKEFNDNSLKLTKQTQENACDKKVFKLFEHQVLVRNFLNPHTPYQNLLLFHDVGMGKTCSAISIAESHKDIISSYNQKIIVILEDSVKQNFINELYSTGKDDNQCTGAVYNNMSILNRKKYIKSNYEFLTLDKFTNDVCKLSKTKKGQEYIHKKFSNTLIIIDEIHNLREYDAIKTNLDSDCKRYSALLNVVSLINNTKLLLMSATPMFDNPREIVSLMNLFILNSQNDLQLSDIPKYRILVEKVFDSEDSITDAGKKILKDNLKGVVSYVRGDNPTTFPTVKYADSATTYPFLKKLKLISTEMSTFQQEEYLNILNENTSIIRQYSNIFMGDKDADEALTKNALKNKDSSVSSKFYTLLKNLEKSSGTSFIYSEFISNGLYLIKEMLLLNGYTEYNPKNNDSTPKFILLEGSMDSKIRTKLIDIFNSNENKDGKLIKIVMGSRVLKEGITLKNVRNVHIMEPWHNMSRLKQVWGRAIRSCSHVALPPTKRNVSIFLYASIFKNIPINPALLLKDYKSVKKEISYDIYSYKRSENKENKIEAIVNILRSIAIDCELHKEYNRNSNDVKCIPIDTENKSIDSSTFKNNDTFFNQPKIDHTIRMIKSEIKKNLSYNITKKSTIMDNAIYQLVPRTTDLSTFQHIFSVNKQQGYVIKRKNYLIFQPLDTNNIKSKSSREKISMYERKHPASKIFKGTAYKATKAAINNTAVVAPVPVINKIIEIENTSIKGNYKGLLQSNGTIKLKKITTDKDGDDKRTESTGRVCNTFNGTDFIEIIKDIKIDNNLIKDFISYDDNKKLKITNKRGLCDTIKNYFYPNSASDSVIKEKKIGVFMFRLINGNLKIDDTRTVSRSNGINCKSLNNDIIGEIKILLNLPKLPRIKLCDAIIQKLFP